MKFPQARRVAPPLLFDYRYSLRLFACFCIHWKQSHSLMFFFFFSFSFITRHFPFPSVRFNISGNFLLPSQSQFSKKNLSYVFQENSSPDTMDDSLMNLFAWQDLPTWLSLPVEWRRQQRETFLVLRNICALARRKRKRKKKEKTCTITPTTPTSPDGGPIIPLKKEKKIHRQTKNSIS